MDFFFLDFTMKYEGAFNTLCNMAIPIIASVRIKWEHSIEMSMLMLGI